MFLRFDAADFWAAKGTETVIDLGNPFDRDLQIKNILVMLSNLKRWESSYPRDKTPQ